MVERSKYSQDFIDWSDMIVTVGGDGTFLLGASKVKGRSKPVIGINSDPIRFNICSYIDLHPVSVAIFFVCKINFR